MRPLCVADLDGTLLTGNSMKCFMRWLPAELLRKRYPLSAVQAIFWTGLRGCRIISHRRMKWHLSAIARRKLSEADWRRFAATLLPIINASVRARIASMRDTGCAVYIASAAMADYVAPLCSLLGYDGHISTPHSTRFADYIEMRGNRKLQAINTLLTTRNLCLSCFLTDHADDLPTAAAYPSETILVNPSPASLARFQEAGIFRSL